MQGRLQHEQAAGHLQQSTGRGGLSKAERTWEKLVQGWRSGAGPGQSETASVKSLLSPSISSQATYLSSSRMPITMSLT